MFDILAKQCELVYFCSAVSAVLLELGEPVVEWLPEYFNINYPGNPLRNYPSVVAEDYASEDVNLVVASQRNE